MTNRAKLNTILAEEYDWELKELITEDAVDYIKELHPSVTVFITKHAATRMGNKLEEIVGRGRIYIIEGLHSRSIYITKKHTAADLITLNAKQLSMKRKNITEQEKILRGKFPRSLEDPHGTVIELDTRESIYERDRQLNRIEREDRRFREPDPPHPLWLSLKNT